MDTEIKSIFELKPGDRIRHGRNYGTVEALTARGPRIMWDYGQLTLAYTEEDHAIHPLYRIDGAQ